MKALVLALATLLGWAAGSTQTQWLVGLLSGHLYVQPLAPGTATNGNGYSYEDY